LSDSGSDTFGVAPPNGTVAPVDNPEVTGGGNAGYNDQLLKNQW